MTPVRFESVREGVLEFFLRADLHSELLPVLRAAPRGWEGFAPQALSGGRGASVALQVGATRYVIRAGRRGGIPGRLLASTYFGFTPRPFDEARATETLRTRGAPVAEVCAALAQWIAPGLYRSWLVTRWIDGARPLVEWASAERRGDARQRGLVAIGQAVARLHAAGARHPDLNAGNVLIVAGDSGDIDVVLIDFDRVRLQPVSARAGARDLARLRRSIDKLDPERRAISVDDFAAILGAHARYLAPRSSLPA